MLYMIRTFLNNLSFSYLHTFFIGLLSTLCKNQYLQLKKNKKELNEIKIKKLIEFFIFSVIFFY